MSTDQKTVVEFQDRKGPETVVPEKEIDPSNAEAKELRNPVCVPPEASEAVTEILRGIMRERKRPLFALICNGGIDEDVCRQVYSWKRELLAVSKGGRQIDILIHSSGGILTSCYVVGRLFSNVEHWEALIPALAASGATLICLGSANIVMSGIAQLSPVDPQVISKRREKFFVGERQSPLEAFQAMAHLRKVTLSSFDAFMAFLNRERQVAPQRALETAAKMASDLVQPILGQIDPYDLGAFSLDNEVAVNYCSRIAQPPDLRKKTQRNANFRALVEKYPAHEFFIDLAEAQALGFAASEPTESVDQAFNQLLPHLENLESYIGLVSEPEVKG